MNGLKNKLLPKTKEDSIYSRFWLFEAIMALFGLKKVQFQRSGIIVPINISTKIWSVAMIAVLMVTQPLNNFFNPNRTVDQLLILVCDFNERLTNGLIMLTNSVYFTTTNVLLYSTFNSILPLFGEEMLKINDEWIGKSLCKKYIILSILLASYTALVVTMIFYGTTPYIFVFRVPVTLQAMHFVLHVSTLAVFLRILNSKLSAWCDGSSHSVFCKHSVLESIFFLETRPHEGRHWDIPKLMDLYDRLANCSDLLGNIHGFQFLLSSWTTFLTTVVLMSFYALDRGVPQAVSAALCCHSGACLLCACAAAELLRLEVQRTDTLVMRHLISVRCDKSRYEKFSMFKQLVECRRMRFSCCGLFHIDYGLLLKLVVSTLTYSVILIQLLSSRTN